jgi:hypothetical protein
LSDPNDEAISGHHLYESGWSDVLWAGVVGDSNDILALERHNRAHPNHDPLAVRRPDASLILTKECVVEVVAESAPVPRFEGTTLDAASTAMRG